MPNYNRVSILSLDEWSKPDSVFPSDACESGCGAWFDKKFFHRVFPDFIKDMNVDINGLELLTIIIC